MRSESHHWVTTKQCSVVQQTHNVVQPLIEKYLLPKPGFFEPKTSFFVSALWVQLTLRSGGVSACPSWVWLSLLFIFWLGGFFVLCWVLPWWDVRAITSKVTLIVARMIVPLVTVTEALISVVVLTSSLAPVTVTISSHLSSLQLYCFLFFLTKG